MVISQLFQFRYATVMYNIFAVYVARQGKMTNKGEHRFLNQHNIKGKGLILL